MLLMQPTSVLAGNNQGFFLSQSLLSTPPSLTRLILFLTAFTSSRKAGTAHDGTGAAVAVSYHPLFLGELKTCFDLADLSETALQTIRAIRVS
jgi:hypothetical protein